MFPHYWKVVKHIFITSVMFLMLTGVISPVQAASVVVESISAGWIHTCGLQSDGTLACWGANDYGQATPPSGTFTQVSTGGYHACGVKSDGNLACWGSSEGGRLILPAGTFTQVSAGYSHTCAQKSDGSLVCWGSNENQWDQIPAPVGTFTQFSAGGHHTCGVKSDGTLACWALNDSGQSTPPAGTFTQVSAGYEHTCGVRSNGTLACWGAGTTVTGTWPEYGQSIPPTGTFTQVSAGYDHTCGIKSNGTLACWGDNFYGESSTPAGIFTQVSAGNGYTCGLKSDGNLTCWGYNVIGQSNPFSISGSVGVAGATLSYTDGFDKTAPVDDSGNYSFAVSYDWSGTVTPSKTYYSFSPVNRSYSNILANQTGQNYTAGSVVINGGVTYTTSTSVNLNLSAADATSIVAEMSFSNEGSTWSDWQTYDTSSSWTLSTGDGIKTVYARFKDTLGNISTNASDTITLDTVPPTPGDLTINAGALATTATNVTLGLSATDLTSGVTQMAFSNDGSTWSTWQAYAASASWTLSTGDGTKTVYARFGDDAGNNSSPVSNTIELDTTTLAEYGLTINAGDLFTNQTAVALTISAKPGTAQIQVSNDGGFTGAQWEPYTYHKAWTITQYGSYVIPRNVYVRYKDLAGNVSSNYQDDIILDVTPPEGSVSISTTGLQAMASNVTLELSATDDVSGVGQMSISNRPDFTGATWESYATSRTWALGSNGTVYVRFKDNAGNVSTTYSASSTTNWIIYLPLILR